MNDRDISIRAKDYVQSYRNEQGENTQATRRLHKNPMMVLFIDNEAEKNEKIFDFNECKYYISSDAGNFWINHSSIVYVDVNNDNCQDSISEGCKQLLKGDKSVSANAVTISIVLKSYDRGFEKLQGVIGEVIKNLRFILGSNIDFTLYTLISTLDINSLNNFKEHFDYITELMKNDEILCKCPIRSFFIGDRTSDNNQIPPSKMYEALASNIVLLNNSRSITGVSINDFFSLRETTLLGFSKAEIPLETVYIIGFDVFSDTILNFFKKGKSNAEPDYDFNIKKDILGEYITAMNNNCKRYSMGAQFLLNRGGIPAGQYAFEQINAEYFGNIEKYVYINMERDRIAAPDEEEIFKAMDKYLLRCFETYGMEKAQKILSSIYDKVKNTSSQQITDYRMSQFYFDPANTQTLDAVITQIVNTTVDKTVNMVRDSVVKYCENGEKNILNIIASTIRTIEEATEKCKNEAVIMDSKMNSQLVKRYEQAVMSKADEITEAIRNNAMQFNFNDAASLESSIFSYYEDRIVRSVLFKTMNNYEDDIDKMTYDQARSWLSSQEGKADLTVRLTNQMVDTRLIVMTDMDIDENLNIVMTYMKERNYSILPVSGMPVFRCMKYRTKLKPTDLFALQYI